MGITEVATVLQSLMGY